MERNQWRGKIYAQQDAERNDKPKSPADSAVSILHTHLQFSLAPGRSRVMSRSRSQGAQQARDLARQFRAVFFLTARGERMVCAMFRDKSTHSRHNRI